MHEVFNTIKGGQSKQDNAKIPTKHINFSALVQKNIRLIFYSASQELEPRSNQAIFRENINYILQARPVS